MRRRTSELTRRGFVVASAAALAGPRLWPATPSCTLIPEQEEGPFYLDSEIVRRNLTENRPGVPLRLQVALLDAKRCAPLENAAVDIWHCDAMGVYSGFTAEAGREDGGRGPGRGFGGPPPGGPPRGGPPPGGRGRGPGRRGGPRTVDDTRFLRGVQVTNRQGVVEFETVYPGWYAGRTIHIHLKVHLGGAESEHDADGRVSHTGQLFFPEEISAEIAQKDPYVTHRRTLHSEDRVYLSQGGAQSILQMERLTKDSNAGGFLAAITLAVDPDATPAPF